MPTTNGQTMAAWSPAATPIRTCPSARRALWAAMLMSASKDPNQIPVMHAALRRGLLMGRVGEVLLIFLLVIIEGAVELLNETLTGLAEETAVEEGPLFALNLKQVANHKMVAHHKAAKVAMKLPMLISKKLNKT